jgi:hypothetical protein
VASVTNKSMGYNDCIPSGILDRYPTLSLLYGGCLFHTLFLFVWGLSVSLPPSLSYSLPIYTVAISFTLPSYSYGGYLSLSPLLSFYSYGGCLSYYSNIWAICSVCIIRFFFFSSYSCGLWTLLSLLLLNLYSNIYSK